jgi:hypothetical protein
MAHVRLRLIFHPEVQGRKSSRKLTDDPILEAHNGSLKASAAVTVNLPEGIDLGALQVWCRCKHNKSAMKLDSPLFDCIRVKPAGERRRTDWQCCNWPGCREAATHRAPKGRLREGEYWHFCLEHVRIYNHSYDYFAGMSEEAIAHYQKEALTGHRPTWKLGLSGRQPGAAWRSHAAFGVFTDSFGLFSEVGPRMRRDTTEPRESRPVRNAERRALDVLGLEADATAAEIKARFKVLVKRHHPDANGGDRTAEDRLREIIQAYNYLKSVRPT